MGAMFSGPKLPAPQKPIIPAPAPVRDDQAVADAATSARQRLAGLLGRSRTVLGNPADYQAAPDRRPVLLGVG